MEEIEHEEDEPKRYPVRETPMMHAAARSLVSVIGALGTMENQLESSDIAHALQSNRTARDGVQRAVQFLIVGGARASDRIPPAPRRELLNSPAALHLLDVMRLAIAAAEVVDAERGQVLPSDFPLKPGEPRGTGWAETINELAIRLKSETETGTPRAF